MNYFWILTSIAHMNRITQIIIALVTASTILFSQLAMATHSCPTLAHHLTVSVDDDCSCQISPEPRSALCKNHCDNNKKNIAATGNAEIPAFLPAYAIMVLQPTIAKQIVIFHSSRSSTQLSFSVLLKHANLRI